MELHSVKSTLLESVGYDEDKQELCIRFHKGGSNRGGGSYTYRGIPRKMYDAMMNDASAGGYFIQNIKGRFKCSKEST